MQEHAASLGGHRKRKIHVANLDPAAEVFHYSPVFDVRDLVSVPEVMEELGLVGRRQFACVRFHHHPDSHLCRRRRARTELSCTAWNI